MFDVFRRPIRKARTERLALQFDLNVKICNYRNLFVGELVTYIKSEIKILKYKSSYVLNINIFGLNASKALRANFIMFHASKNI